MDVIPAVKVAVRTGVIYIMASLISGGYCSLIVMVNYIRHAHITASSSELLPSEEG